MVMSIANFEDKFKDDLRPYWKIFIGRGYKVQVDGNMEMENIDESWTMLYNSLSRYDSGTFKVLTFSNPNATNSSGWETTIKTGNGVGATSSNNNRVQGMANMEMFKMMQFFQSQQDARLKAELAAAEIRAKENMKFMKEIIELKHEKAELKGTLEAGTESAKEALVGELIASVSPLVDVITDAIRYKFMPDIQPIREPAQLGTAGQKELPVATEKKQVAKTKAVKAISFNRLVQATNKMQAALPDYDINECIELLAAFAEREPKKVVFMIDLKKKDYKLATTTNAPSFENIDLDRLAMAAQKARRAITKYHVNDTFDLLAYLCETETETAKDLIKKLKGDG